MFSDMLARTAQMAAAITSAALLTAYVTILPVPALAATPATVAAAQR